MKYKIEKDKHNKFNVMFKKGWLFRWKYARSPKGNIILDCKTEKGAQAYIDIQ
jgi:outer membrane lipoprotein-sorting protein